MEHLCYKCQTSLDESLPFCPHCGAPQIRVATPEEEPQPSPDAPVPVVAPPVWPSSAPAYHPNAIQWNIALRGALLSGLVSAVLSAIPVVSLGCCLWLLGAGVLAVWLYQRRLPGVYVTPGMGSRIGAVSGAIGFMATTLWMVFQFGRNSGEFRTAMTEQLQKSVAANPDPKAQEVMQQFMANLNTPEGLATFFVLVLIVLAVVFVLFSAAGGALGASMFGRRRHMQ